MGGGASIDQKIQQQGLRKTLEEVTLKETKEKDSLYTKEQKNRLNARFRQLDEDNSNTISIEELKHFAEIQTHFFKERIYQLAQEFLDTKKQKEFSFDNLQEFLKPFHPSAELDLKYEFLFKIFNTSKVSTPPPPSQ